MQGTARSATRERRDRERGGKGFMRSLSTAGEAAEAFFA
jgi:hypothetical protein